METVMEMHREIQYTIEPSPGAEVLLDPSCESGRRTSARTDRGRFHHRGSVLISSH